MTNLKIFLKTDFKIQVKWFDRDKFMATWGRKIVKYIAVWWSFGPVWWSFVFNKKNNFSIKIFLFIGYLDRGAEWRSSYEHPQQDKFEEDLENLWLSIKPLYEELHAYTRHKLSLHYSNYSEFFPKSGHIPMHILGIIQIFLSKIHPHTDLGYFSTPAR